MTSSIIVDDRQHTCSYLIITILVQNIVIVSILVQNIVIIAILVQNIVIVTILAVNCGDPTASVTTHFM